MIDVIGLITARGGSKGIPRKHLAPLCGKPLVAWTVEAAGASRHLRRVIISTDDEEIVAVCRALGAEVPFLRPAGLATDDAAHVPVVEHALQWMESVGDRPEFCMLLQPTSPLRTAEDIDAAIELADSTDADAVVSVREAEQHPYKMFQITPDGALSRFMVADLDYLRRQDLPRAFAENGAIYLNRCSCFLASRTFIPEGARPYVMPAERSVDIDTIADLRLAEWLLTQRQEAPAR